MFGSAWLGTTVFSGSACSLISLLGAVLRVAKFVSEDLENSASRCFISVLKSLVSLDDVSVSSLSTSL